MKPTSSKHQGYRRPYHRHQSKPLINYQIKESGSDSDNNNRPSPRGFTQTSFSTLYSGSEEENKRKESYKVKIMFEGQVLKDSEGAHLPSKEHKFQDAREKSGPNPKNISMPWFV